MRYQALMIAVLLGGCTVNEDADNAAIEANGAMESSGSAPVDGDDVPIPDGGDSVPPGNNGGNGNGGNGTGGNENGTPEPEPERAVTLSAAPARVAAGATMTLTLTNNLRQGIGYNLCSSAIETRAGRQVETGRICTLELRTLEPGRSVNYAYDLPDNLADGSYRFLANFERLRAGTRHSVRSNGFEVR